MNRPAASAGCNQATNVISRTLLYLFLSIIYLIYLHAQHANSDSMVAGFGYDFYSSNALRVCSARSLQSSKSILMLDNFFKLKKHVFFLFYSRHVLSLIFVVGFRCKCSVVFHICAGAYQIRA